MYVCMEREREREREIMYSFITHILYITFLNAFIVLRAVTMFTLSI